MKKFNTDSLLEDLKADVQQIIMEVKALEQTDTNTMLMQPAEGKWSVAQIIAHLNFYSNFYLRMIEEKLNKSGYPRREYFISGWLGNYFTKMMKPSSANEVKNKMKTMKNAVPSVHIDARENIAQFLRDQQKLLDLLERAKNTDLSKIRVPITLTNMVALKLGDTFRFLIAHEQRHMVQMRNTLSALQQLRNPVQPDA